MRPPPVTALSRAGPVGPLGMQLCVEPAADWLVQLLHARLAAKPVRPLPHVCSFSAFHVLFFSPVATWIGLSALQTPPSAATCNSQELTLLSAVA